MLDSLSLELFKLLGLIVIVTADITLTLPPHSKDK